MNWYHDLYIGKRVAKKADALRQKLEAGHKDPSLYLITIPNGKHNQLEILPSWQYKDSVLIVGIAANKGEAIEMVTDLTAEVVQKTGCANIRKYLERKQEEQECCT